MEPSSAVRARLWLGGLAAAGVVVTHHLAYLVTAPDPHERAELLAAGGHARWSLVVAAALGLLVAGLAGFVRRTLRANGTLAPWPYTGGTLALLQGSGFVALEAVERAAVGDPGLAPLLEPVVVVGILVQVLVALLGAGLLVVLGGAVRAWVARRSRPRRRTVALPAPDLDLLPARFSAAVAGGGGLRAPPGRRA